MNFISPALQMAIRVSIGVAIAEALSLLINAQYNYWATMTVFLVMCPSWGATIQKGIKRLGMTILGCSLGGAIYFFTAHSQPALFIGLTISVFLMIYVLNTSYNWSMFYGGFFLVFLFAVGTTGWSISLLYYRIGATAVGCLIAIIVSRFVFPSSSVRKFSVELPELFQNLKILTENIAWEILNREKAPTGNPFLYNPTINSLDNDILRLKGNHLSASYESILKKRSGILSKKFITLLDILLRNLGHLARTSKEMKDNSYVHIFYEVILELSGAVEGKLDYIISSLKEVDTRQCLVSTPECIIDTKKLSKLYAAAKKEGATEADLLAVTAVMYYQRKMNENLKLIIEL
jgi:uncharacterized membrane protein YgaE (UPF0421/DUF939 family)